MIEFDDATRHYCRVVIEERTRAMATTRVAKISWDDGPMGPEVQCCEQKTSSRAKECLSLSVLTQLRLGNYNESLLQIVLIIGDAWESNGKVRWRDAI